MIKNISFGANFVIEPYSVAEKKQFAKEGFDDERIQNLSDNLNSKTSPNYKLALVYRDRTSKEDHFVLRKKQNNKWKAIAACTTDIVSRNSAADARLLNIYKALKLKAKHAEERAILDLKIQNMKNRHEQELSNISGEFKELNWIV